MLILIRNDLDFTFYLVDLNSNAVHELHRCFAVCVVSTNHLFLSQLVPVSNRNESNRNSG